MVGVLASVVAGCSGLPRSGPSHQSIKSSASDRVVATAQARFTLVDLSPATVAFFRASRSSLQSLNTGSASASPAIVIGVGDTVSISIFESSAGGLFIPSEAGVRPGNFVSLPTQIVDATGYISVPYAGRIRVNGRTTSAVQKEIEGRLANRAIEPQAIVSLTDRSSSEVAVLGDVRGPARFVSNPSGDRLLDVIARAGGLSGPDVETRITLQRGDRVADIDFVTLVKDQAENIYVRPGDIIYAKRERRTYVAFGASGLNGRIDFDESALTLAEAIGQAGGLLDSRADPAEVFLYRQVDTEILRRLGVALPAAVGVRTPVVFHVDLRNPSTFFAAQQLLMQDKDILYVSNSNSEELKKFLDILNNVSTTAGGVPSDVVRARNAVRSLN
jgi:polysaccharide export outer membrane protein